MSEQQTPQHWFSWDKVKDLLTILVIPALLWVSSVSTELQLLGLRVDNQTTATSKLEQNLEVIEGRTVETGERLARLEARIESIGERINEIRDILVGRTPPRR